MQTIDLEHFKKIDFRVGTILRVEPFEKARKPAYQVWVDLGSELGIKKSSAQLTVHYQPEDLLRRTSQLVEVNKELSTQLQDTITRYGNFSSVISAFNDCQIEQNLHEMCCKLQQENKNLSFDL